MIPFHFPKQACFDFHFQPFGWQPGYETYAGPLDLPVLRDSSILMETPLPDGDKYDDDDDDDDSQIHAKQMIWCSR